MKARLRPMIDPILPPVTISMAITSVYRTMALWIPVIVVSRSSATVAIETFMTELSSAIKNWPAARIRRTIPAALCCCSMARSVISSRALDIWQCGGPSYAPDRVVILPSPRGCTNSPGWLRDSTSPRSSPTSATTASKRTDGHCFTTPFAWPGDTHSYHQSLRSLSKLHRQLGKQPTRPCKDTVAPESAIWEPNAGVPRRKRSTRRPGRSTSRTRPNASTPRKQPRRPPSGERSPNRTAPSGSSGAESTSSCAEIDRPRGGRCDHRPRFDIAFGGADRRRTRAARSVLRGPADPRVPSRRSRRDPRTGGRLHPRRRVRGGPDRAAAAERPISFLPRPLDPAQSEPGRSGGTHSAERAWCRPEPQLPVPLAPWPTGPLLPRAATRVRTRDADRHASDPADRARREHLGPPAARACRRVGRRPDPGPGRPPGGPAP